MTHSFKLNIVDWTALALVVAGALNWGLMGLAYVLGRFVTVESSWNLVAMLAEAVTVPELEFAIYLVVGLAAVWTGYLATRLAGVTDDEPVVETPRSATK